ncbi:hypothetical protein [Rhizorhapis suberifaciens]|uniref:Uncharacterized protein n=1 Tax=Rhizorhapis suberifaciens TaxID=13656 RepID=A0A840HWE0_9SPHN|nr:hypothetical protein [Rhizorhapis suberifaciens]MBB4642385.1 hypothetical protein [Rhizorhapis suberifaciens]
MIGKFLLGGLGWLREAISALLSVIRQYPWQCAVAALLALLLWQNGTLNGVRKDLLAMTKARDAEQVAHKQTVQNYHDASKRAQEAAVAEKQRVETEHRRMAQHADQNYDSLRAQYRALLLQRTASTNSSGARETGLPVNPGTPGVPESGTSVAWLYISQPDAMKCADLGAYSMAAFKWGEEVAKSSTLPSPPRE